MELLGYLLAVLIGVSLGLIGGGGAILTVPILVYLFSIEPLLATSYSLFIVGITSLAGAVKNFRRGNVDVKVALLFGAASITTVLLVRKLVLPLLPQTLAHAGSLAITRSFVIMVLFALLMLLAAFIIISDRKKEPLHKTVHAATPILLYGILIGLVTGLLGAGGGFLLIPALVMFIKLPMKKAVGTSLTIIAATSLIGFLGDVAHHPIDWRFLLAVAALAIAGIYIGIYMGHKVSGSQLKKGFGWFVLITGLFILISELVKLFR